MPTTTTSELPGLSTESKSGRAAKGRRGTGWTPALFILPFGIPFLLFYVAPIVYAAYQSLFKVQRTGGIYGKSSLQFSWFSQYGAVFSSADFRSSVVRVLAFGLVQIPVMLILSLAMALLLDSTVVYLKRFLRIAFFVPYGIPGVIAAIMWGFIYSPGLSPVVALLNKFNVSIDFLGSHVVLWSIANVVTGPMPATTC